MGRKKVQLKRIENKSSRQITFSKRRNGLVEKAREFSLLCDIQVSPLIFSSRGRLFEFSSVGSLAKILKLHRSHIEEKTVLSKGANDEELYHSKYENFKSYAELLQIVHRHLGGSNFEELTLSDLVQIEIQLDAALTYES